MKLSIFLYCSSEVERSIRCINSILRQKNENIDLQLVFDTEEAKNQILASVSPIEAKYTIKGHRTNKESFTELMENCDADYFMFAFFNQIFTLGCFDNLETTLADCDGAIVNFSYRRGEAFLKAFTEVSYASFFSTAPFCYNIIFKMDIFKKKPIYFSLQHEEQPFLAASYFSYAQNILFLDTVFYYRDTKPYGNVFIADITYSHIWWLEKICSKLKKVGKTDCAVSFLSLYIKRISTAKSRAKGIKQKLKYRYFSKKFGEILF